MASYTRQSSFADGDTITAALFNNEFNQLVNAFHNSTGHKHDGTTAEGPVIGLIGDAGETSPNNKVLIDTTNNYIEFYVEVSSAPVQQLYIADGAIIPVTDSDVDLGTTSLRFKDTYTDTVTTTGNVSVGGNLTVTGNATISGNLTFGDADTDSINLAAEIDSDIIPNTDGTYDLGSATKEWQDLYIDGTANIDSLVADTADINGGTIDGATIATSDITVGSGKTLDVSSGTLTLADDQISGDKVEGGTIAATTITTLTSTTGNVTNVNATTVDTTNIEVTNIKAKDGTAAGSIADSTGVVTLASSVLTTTDINGGTIDGTTIATSDITVGASKTLDVSAGTLTLADNQISGDKVEGGTIAATTITDLTFGSLNDGTITATAFVDEDDMTSDSATLIPTQQSVKAYVDSQVTAQDLDLTTDSGTIAIDLDSETLTIGGTSNEIETSATGNAVTIGIPAAAQITTSLGIGGGSTNGVQISQGAISIKNGGTQSYIDFYCESSNAHYARLQAPAHGSFSGNPTLTLPATAGTIVGSGDSGTVTNTMLAGSIANSKLSNSTVSYGGVSLALGASDATPAFDLADATNYPTSSLTGTITNAQLAGSIANAKLANSSITVSGGTSTTAIALGGTITFAGTSNEVDVSESSGTITYGLPSDVTITNDLTVSNDLVVSGNLTVTGTTTQTGPIVSDDNFTGLTNGNTGNATDFGLYGKYVESSTTKYAGLFYDASTDNTFRLFTDTQTEPATTVNTGATGYAAADLIIAGLTASSGTVSGDLTVDTNTLKVDSTNNRVGILNASPDVSLDVGSATDAIHVPSGTTAQRPTGANGYFRYNTTDAQFEGYADGAWGAIAGSGGGSGSAIEPQIFAGDGSTVDFTLTSAPTSENNLLVFIDGVFQAHDSYSVSGTTLTFSTAPANTRVVTVYHARSSISGSNMIVDTMTGDNSDVTLTLSVAPVSENNVQVYFDGVYQSKANYSISGTTLTFSTAPATGVAVEAITHTQTTINEPAANTVTPAKIAAGDFYFDTDTLYIDSTNNRVGIGTSSPGGILDIKKSYSGNTLLSRLWNSEDSNAASNAEFRIVSGNAATPILTFGDSGAVRHSISVDSSDNVLFKHAGSTEQLRIDSSGNLLLGTTSHSTGAFGAATGINIKKPRPQVLLQDTTNNTDGYFGLSTGALFLATQDNINIQFYTNDVERMRIDSAGNLLVGTTSTLGASAAGTTHITGGSNSTDETPLYLRNPNSTAGRYWKTGPTNNAGYIVYNNANTGVYITYGNNSWTSGSDESLKENISDVGSVIDKVKDYRCVNYSLKSQNADTADRVGFIAQDWENDFPNVVDKNDEGILGMKYTETIPVLLKAIQEQQALIETQATTITDLTTRIETLENA